MNTFYRKLRIAALIALAMAAGAIFFAAQAADTQDSEQVSSLLSEVKTQAIVLSEDAEAMESFTRTKGLNWKTHANAVTRMKEHINEAGRLLAKLQQAQAEASPWQRSAISRIHPLLKEIADNTEKAIQYISENPQRLFMDEYENYIEANADLSTELASMISDFVSYGNTRERMEELTNKLELSTKR